MTRFRSFAAVLATMALLAGCSAGTAPATSAPSRVPSRPPAPVTVPQSTPVAEDVLILRRLASDAYGAYTMMFGRNGEQLFNLPDGAAARGFRTIAAATRSGDKTAVQLLSGEGGELQAQASIGGAWRLPAMGLVKRPAGVSADGRTVVLEQARETTTSPSRTSFAVVKVGNPTKTSTFSLDGDFSFDALSPDGSWLYVIEHRDGGTYRVRRADPVLGKLDDAVIVDKRSPGEVMSGYALTQLAAEDGWVYTVYAGADGLFIHALNTVDGVAFCIDLPRGDHAEATDATLASWALALGRNGHTLYAANGALGSISEISLDDFAVTRTVAVPKQVGAITLAKFEHGEWNDAGSAAVSPDGKVLYVAGPHGVTALETSKLSPIGVLGGDREYRSVTVGLTENVYAVDTAGALSRLGTPASPSHTRLGDDAYASIEGVLSLR